MENQRPEEIPSAVRGLLDADRVAEYLGVPRGTLRSWEKRKADGKPGLHNKFPAPIPERLGGAALWDQTDILAFKRWLDERKQPRAADKATEEAKEHS